MRWYNRHWSFKLFRYLLILVGAALLAIYVSIFALMLIPLFLIDDIFKA